MFPPPTNAIFMGRAEASRVVCSVALRRLETASALARLDQLLEVVQACAVGAVDHLDNLLVRLAAAGLVVELALPDHLGQRALAFLHAKCGDVMCDRERRIAHDAIAEEHLLVV